MPARKKYFSKLIDKIKVFFKKRVTKFKSFSKNHKLKIEKSRRGKEVNGRTKNKISNLIKWIFEVSLYGLGLNFMVWQLFGLPISILKVLAWGIAYYFISAELPQICLDCFRGIKR